jgi:hypothetical protein
MVAKQDSETKNSEAVRKARVRQLWQVSPERNNSETGPLNFYKWLQEHNPDLLPPGQGDPYQRLRAELMQSENPEAKPENK